MVILAVTLVGGDGDGLPARAAGGARRAREPVRRVRPLARLREPPLLVRVGGAGLLHDGDAVVLPRVPLLDRHIPVALLTIWYAAEPDATSRHCSQAAPVQSLCWACANRSVVPLRISRHLPVCALASV